MKSFDVFKVFVTARSRAKTFITFVAMLAITVNSNLHLVAQTTATTFTQSGTGATTRPLASKLGDIVNVKDFGAVCDGMTNDRVAIDAAINSTHQGVEFPEGVCAYQNAMYPVYSHLTNKQIYSSSRTTISFMDNGSGTDNGVGWNFDLCTNLTIKGMTFTYMTTPPGRTSGDALWISNSTNVFLSDIAVLSSPGVGMFFTLDTGLQANNLHVQNTLADGIQNQDMIGMVETNLFINNTGDDGLAMHCVTMTSNCFSSSAVQNYGIAANIVADQIGTFHASGGSATGGKAISIDGGRGITVNGARATNIAGDCTEVYTDGTAHYNVPNAIILNDIGCTNVGLPTMSGGGTGISVDAGLNIYINNPNINTTSFPNTNLAPGIRVNNQSATVWVNGGIVQNLAGEGVRVDDSTLFHMTGTQVIGANYQGIVVGQSHAETSDIQLTNVLVRDVAKTAGFNRAVDLEGLNGLLDVRGVTIQDDQSTATGYNFFTSGLSAVKGFINGVSGYVADTTMAHQFTFYSGSTDTILRRDFSGINAAQPNCTDTTFEGLTWYTAGSGTTAGSFQVCKYLGTMGSYGWSTP